MKQTVVVFLLLSVFLIGATNRDIGYSYRPVLMKRSELEKSVFFREKQTIGNPGKIYYKDKTIYLVEKYKGVHVIDNSDPRNPQQTGFINLPGCVDISIKKNSLYADNAVDLVAVDISNYPNISVTSRVKNVFPELPPPDIDYVPWEYEASQRPDNTIIVNWETPGSN